MSLRDERNAPIPVPLRPRSAYARAANTTTSKTWATPHVTTPSSRCSATFRLATISKRRRLSLLGIWWSTSMDYQSIGCGSPSTRMTMTPPSCGRKLARLWNASFALVRRTTTGRWERLGRVDRARKSTTIVARTPSRPTAQSWSTVRAMTLSRSGTWYSCSSTGTPRASCIRYRNPVSTPAPGSSGLPWSCRGSRPTMRPISLCLSSTPWQSSWSVPTIPRTSSPPPTG